MAVNDPFWGLFLRRSAASGASCTLRRTQTTSRAGSAPVQNITRQAMSSSRNWKTIV
jgi:hypothetical protein